MTLLWIKLVHIAAVSVWAGGLLALPLLLATQATAPTRWAALRHFYIGWLSPAAFVAILSGGALAGIGTIHTDWFAAKLTLVTLFALVHVLVARRVAEGKGHSALFLRSLSATAAAIALGVLWLVLAKPGIALPCDGLGEDRHGEVRLLVLSVPQGAGPDRGGLSSSCAPPMASP